MSEIPIRESHLPEPHYQCAGINTFRTAAIADNHPRFSDDGFRKASELFWVNLEERESDESCTDFFCAPCVGAMGRKTGGKKTLQQALERLTSEKFGDIIGIMKISAASR